MLSRADALEGLHLAEACALAGIYAEQRATEAARRRQSEGVTVNLRTGVIKGKVPVVRPTAKQAADLDALFPPGWMRDPSQIQVV